ncbi:hypothetical protein MMC34_007025 [Xylographa carneopallida]|nr:hypothetical protein [Xylographa carneopallida]
MILDEVRYWDRRCGDLTRDDLGCFCAPRPEEWWWNSEPVKHEEVEAETQGVWNGVFSDAGTVSPREEAPAMQGSRREVEKNKLIPAIPSRRRGSSDPLTTIKRQDRLDILELRQELLTSASTQAVTAASLLRTECEFGCRNNRDSQTSSEATTTRNESRTSSASSMTLKTEEEHVLFDNVRRKLPAMQRSVENEVLGCGDRLQEHCDCVACDKWRVMQQGSKDQVDREDV